MLDDPCVNFAISTVSVNRPGGFAGVSHLGIQAENETELAEVYDRLTHAERPIIEAKATTCCYAKSDKQCASDPLFVRSCDEYRNIDRWLSAVKR